MIVEWTRRQVRTRAAECCEYCRLPESAVSITFHVEHIVAQQHQRDDDPSNLALACDRCNLYKGSNLTSIDPQTHEVVRLFHPRNDHWHEHFEWRDAIALGKTPTGRATVHLLNINAKRRVHLRQQLIQRGEQL